MLEGKYTIQELWGMLREMAHEAKKEMEATIPFEIKSSWEEPGVQLGLVVSRITYSFGQAEGDRAAAYVRNVAKIPCVAPALCEGMDIPF